ncbi:hypothetical protein SAMN06272789_6676 [Streptomyces sp. 1331.2]|nr:hypothetical protein SAMN06272789_6676 [Streptomyces sp. 1331.2]
MRLCAASSCKPSGPDVTICSSVTRTCGPEPGGRCSLQQSREHRHGPCWRMGPPGQQRPPGPGGPRRSLCVPGDCAAGTRRHGPAGTTRHTAREVGGIDVLRGMNVSIRFRWRHAPCTARKLDMYASQRPVPVRPMGDSRKAFRRCRRSTKVVIAAREARQGSAGRQPNGASTAGTPHRTGTPLPSTSERLRHDPHPYRPGRRGRRRLAHRPPDDPGVCAATSTAATSTAAVTGSDSLGWGGVTTPTTPTSTDSLGWGGVTQASLVGAAEHGMDIVYASLKRRWPGDAAEAIGAAEAAAAVDALWAHAEPADGLQHASAQPADDRIDFLLYLLSRDSSDSSGSSGLSDSSGSPARRARRVGRSGRRRLPRAQPDRPQPPHIADAPAVLPAPGAAGGHGLHRPVTAAPAAPAARID